ncbi:MAG TPA: hypothetical protein VFI23_03815 [Rhizomicrobium sp.]|nr:hypothetical protein [Rhizomicrobium sp.]
MDQSAGALSAFDPHQYAVRNIAMTITGIVDARGGAWRAPESSPSTVLRHGLSAASLAAVSGAHFLSALILLRHLPAREFGLVSFVMVVVAFGMSLNGALISLPITRGLAVGQTAMAPACFQMNWLTCLGFAALLFGMLLLSAAPFRDALLLALYAAVFIFRGFARSVAFIDGRGAAAIRSDIVYGVLLTGALGFWAALHRLSFTTTNMLLLLSALAALAPFGAKFFRTQFAALGGDPRRYGAVFRDVTRWSLAGVVLTELTVNAHAYLVTLISGPRAFALLALGTLLMRPAALMQSALPDLERPRLARALAAKDDAALSRIAGHVRLSLCLAWLGNILLCAGLLAFLPALVVKPNYGRTDVILVASLCGAIMLIRALRMPLAVLLQAAGAFRQLARISAASAAVSLAATLALLLAFGPVASLGGIALGELVILAGCAKGARKHKQNSGIKGSP